MKYSVRSLVVSVLVLVSLSGCGYNKLQGLDENVKASWAEVENQYKRRADLIPNLVNTVKGYAKHEENTLREVIEARSRATSTTINADSLSDPQKMKQFQEAQGAVTGALARLLVVAENYPNLKADQNFRDLQAQLEGTENRITVARKRYIDTVAEYNKGVRFFPTNLTAKFLLGLKERQTFAASEAEKATPKVEF
jgi:LemA protein